MPPTPGKDPKFPTNLGPVSLLSTTCKILEKVILKIVQRHIEEIAILIASRFGFYERRSTTLQCMGFMDDVTLDFNNTMSTNAVLLHIEKIL
jgi:hypothetical protein